MRSQGNFRGGRVRIINDYTADFDEWRIVAKIAGLKEIAYGSQAVLESISPKRLLAAPLVKQRITREFRGYGPSLKLSRLLRRQRIDNFRKTPFYELVLWEKSGSRGKKRKSITDSPIIIEPTASSGIELDLIYLFYPVDVKEKPASVEFNGKLSRKIRETSFRGTLAVLFTISQLLFEYDDIPGLEAVNVLPSLISFEMGGLLLQVYKLCRTVPSALGSSPLGEGEKQPQSQRREENITVPISLGGNKAVNDRNLPFSDEFFPGQLNIVEDRLNQSLAQLFSFMKGNNSATAVGMAEEYMAAFLADCFKAVFLRIWITTVGLRLVRRIIQILPAVRQIQACWGFLPPGIKLLLL